MKMWELVFFLLNLCLGMKVDDGDLPKHADARQDGKTKLLQKITYHMHFSPVTIFPKSMLYDNIS